MEQPANTTPNQPNQSYSATLASQSNNPGWFARHRSLVIGALVVAICLAALAAILWIINAATPPAKNPATTSPTPIKTAGVSQEYMEINSNLLVHGTINGVTNLVDTDAAQTLINKSISGLTNTFSDIPTSAITGGAITIIGTNGLTSGTVSLGGTITLGLTAATTSAISAATCSNCVLNDTAATTATQTITPTANIPSLVLRQTTAGTPTNDIFDVTNSSGSTKYLQLGSNGSIALNPGGGSLLFGQDSTPSDLTFRGGQAVGTDAPGADLTFDASNGTGAGGSGDIIFRTASNSGSLVQVDTGSVVAPGGSLSNVITFSDTIAPNNNRILFVSIVPSSGTVSSITWNGVAMSLLAAEPKCPVVPFANCDHEVWYLINPASGTHNVVITMTDNAALSTFAEAFYNVQQVAPLVQSQSGVALSFSQSFNTDLHELIFESIYDQAVITPTSGQSTLQCFGGSTECEFTQVSDTPTTTLSYTTGFSSDFSEIGALLIPVPATGPDPLLERLRISMSGNIGISNSAPAYPLDVVGNINTDTGYRLNGVNINTAGTLSNVAYLNQANTFTGSNTLSGLNNITSSILNLNSDTNGNTSVIKVPQLATTGTCSSGTAEGAILQNFGGTQVGHLCISGPTAGSPNKLAFYADSFNATSTDLAENYSDYSNSLTSGDVVMIDPTHSKSVIRSNKAYDPAILGVVSSSPGLTLTGIDESGDTDLIHPKPIALSGRVPVKFSNENGEIKVGDYLTSATKPGFAMKATRPGRVIGIALSPAKNGTVLAFINPSYYNPDQTALTPNGLPTSPGSLTDTTLNSITAATGTFQTLNLGSVQLTTDPSGNLKINGNVNVKGNFQIGKDLTLYGTINAPNGLAINLGPDKAFSIDDSNHTSQLSIDKNGAHTKNLQTDKLNISATSHGQAILNKDSDKLIISSTAITADSQIIISFEGDYSPATRYWVGNKISAHSFQVNLDRKVDQNVTVNWWIIN